jgi:hypothetical protein
MGVEILLLGVMPMSFADPQTITVAAVPITLPRVSVGEDLSEYVSGDGLNQLTASHKYGKRTRRMLRYDTSKITTDPFRSTENVRVSMSIYIVVDLPVAGYTATEALAVYTGFKGLMSASSDLVVTKLLGGES